MANSHQYPALEAFSAWERGAWVKISGTRDTNEDLSFMPMEKVKKYFTEDNHSRLNDILEAVYETPYPPIDADSILENHTAIFCILLRLEKAHYIDQFASYEELSDRRLPFDPSLTPIEFREIDDDAFFFDQFCEVQWSYCVPIFDSHMLNKRFGAQRLLPIVHREHLGTEGLASRALIQVYGPYNELQSAVGKSTVASNTNTFILKTYSSIDGNAAYKKEAAGFRGVRAAESILNFYGSYVHGDDYNILMEYADKGSLEDFYLKETPPGRGQEIIKFWEGLFQLIKSLKVIHSVRDGHHDIRPETLCVLSNNKDLPGWRFKFASFGIDCPERRLSEGAEMATYSPPESCNIQTEMDSKPKSSWEADIWALGCIYSEAAVWLADGYKGLLDYRKDRMAELGSISVNESDSFHNGERVLNCVLESHKDVEDRLRRSDHITKDVLESMVDEMLWEEDRPTAQALWRKAEKVLARASQKLSLQTDQLPRPGSRQGRSRLPPRPPIPTQPLPQLPNPTPQTQPSVAGSQRAPLNVERWRSQVGLPQNRTSTMSGTSSIVTSATTASKDLSPSGSPPATERRLAESVTSWQTVDDSSTLSESPNTSYSSTPLSLNFDYHRQLQAQTLGQKIQNPDDAYIKPLSVTSKGFSFASIPEMSDADLETSSSEQRGGYLGNGQIRPKVLAVNHYSSYKDDGHGPDLPVRASSRAGSRASQATTYSIPIQNDTYRSPHASVAEEEVRSLAPIPPRSQYRNPQFSIFPAPAQTREMQPLTPPTTVSVQQNQSEGFLDQVHNDQSLPPIQDTLPRYVPNLDTAKELALSQSNLETINSRSTSNIFLSIDDIITWKALHKKLKKKATIQPLPGFEMLSLLSDREHVFIIDDGASMTQHWTDVKASFEALSYTVKDMSPDGTELFFTNAYDTYRRKNTADLCAHLEKKKCADQTDISHRLYFQWQEYLLRLRGVKVWAGPAANKRSKGAAAVRPTSYYILTDGEWGPGRDLKEVLTEMANALKSMGKEDGQVSVNIISLASSEAAEKRIAQVAEAEYAVDIVAVTTHKGNVLKMLLGPLNRHLDPALTGVDTRPSSSVGRSESRSSGRPGTSKANGIGLWRTNSESIISV